VGIVSQQATVLVAYYDARKREGWIVERFPPLLAGLDSLTSKILAARQLKMEPVVGLELKEPLGLSRYYHPATRGAQPHN